MNIITTIVSFTMINNMIDHLTIIMNAIITISTVIKMINRLMIIRWLAPCLVLYWRIWLVVPRMIIILMTIIILIIILMMIIILKS